MGFLMNRDDVEDAAEFFDDHEDTPNLYHLAQVLLELMRWTSNSDGWDYWGKPADASHKLQALLDLKMRDYWRDGCEFRVNDDGTRGELVKFTDATDAEVKAVLTPIKSFFTRAKKGAYGRIDLTDEKIAQILSAGLPIEVDEDEVRSQVLDDLVHQAASEIASMVINMGDHEDWLRSQGWANEQIEDEVQAGLREARQKAAIGVRA